MYTYICIYIINFVPARVTSLHTYIRIYIYMHTLVRRADSGCVLIKSHLVDFSRCHWLSCYVYIHTYYTGRPGFTAPGSTRSFWAIQESVSPSNEKEEGGETVGVSIDLNGNSVSLAHLERFRRVRCWRLTRGNELSLRKNRLRIGQRVRGYKAARWSRRARDVRSVICLLLYRSYESRSIDCTLQPRLVPCWNLCYRDMWPRERRSTIAGTSARTRSQSNSKCVPRHVAGPQVCSPNRREIVSSIYTHMHIHTYTHTHTHACLCLVDCKCKRLCLEFVNVKWA